MGQGPKSIVLAALAVMLAGSPSLQATTDRTPASSPHKPPRQKKASATSLHRTRRTSTKGTKGAKGAKGTKVRGAASRRSTVHTRLAHMQVAPDRVQQIQQALIDAGQLRGTPSGRWDAETHDAMSRYQAANGFGVTGLPDAKSLMKLGLGPHPLPDSVNPSRASAAGSPAEGVPSSPEDATPADPPLDPPGVSAAPNFK